MFWFLPADTQETCSKSIFGEISDKSYFSLVQRIYKDRWFYFELGKEFKNNILRSNNERKYRKCWLFLGADVNKQQNMTDYVSCSMLKSLMT